jgi:hypothetical protein
MSVDRRACSSGCYAVLFDLRLEVFFQKGKAALFTKHYDGDGESRAGQYLSPLSNAYK